jgi:hypothetical protein
MDAQLGKAGWAVGSRCVVEEFLISSDSPATDESNEFADYVLFDRRRQPIAVVEAKRSSRSPLEGERQSADFADRVQRQTGIEPFIFLANGSEIWFWNRQLNPPRCVSGFFTIDDWSVLPFRRNIAKTSTPPRTAAGKLSVKPEIRSDNRSGYISMEFHGLLESHGLTHHKITPHCPEENGIMERANRTFREALEEVEVRNRIEAEDALPRIIAHQNTERLHSSLGYLRPADYYRGNPVRLHARRRRKLSQARHRRKQINLGIRQRTLPFENPETVSSHRP